MCLGRIKRFGEYLVSLWKAIFFYKIKAILFLSIKIYFIYNIWRTALPQHPFKIVLCSLRESMFWGIFGLKLCLDEFNKLVKTQENAEDGEVFVSNKTYKDCIWLFSHITLERDHKTSMSYSSKTVREMKLHNAFLSPFPCWISPSSSFHF